MRWIGQHIWDFISRFRSKVYLEDVDNAGSDTDAFLVKKTDGEVAIRTGAEVLSDIGASSESTDLEFSGSTTNGVLTYGGAAQIDVEDKLTWNPSTGELKASASLGPFLELTNINADLHGGVIQLKNYRGSTVSAGSDGDSLGRIEFMGGDSGGALTTYAQITAEIGDNTHTEEAGDLFFKVAEYDGTLTTGLKLDGDTDEDGEIDVTIGAGVGSITTIAGDLDIDGDNVTSAGALTITPGGAFSVAGGSSEIDLTTTGTLDINANALDMDLTDSSSIILTASEDAEDFLIRQTGAHDASIILDAAGTGSDAINIGASAGGVTVNAADTYTLTSGKSKFNKIYDFHASEFENLYSSGQGTGTIIRYEPNGDSTPTAGQVYYLRSTNGSWLQADADSDATSTGLLGVGLGASSQTSGVLLNGFVRVPSTEILNVPGSGRVDGVPVYLGTEAGHFDFTAPSGPGDIVRILGYAIDDDGGDVLIYFNPDKTWIERV